MQRQAAAFTVLLLISSLVGCAGPSLEQRRQNAAEALEALRAADFDTAEREAERVIAEDEENPFARVIRAMTRFHTTLHQAWIDGASIVAGAWAARGFNHKYARTALTEVMKGLAAIDADLQVVERFEDFSLELCLACWERDWNHSGEVDDRDRLIFQIELDANGERLPDDDPRRRPTFRFDHGDVLWARAFVSFARAALQTSLAYKWSEVDAILRRGGPPPTITIRIDDPKRIAEARRLILEGLDLADRAREAYLAETDDEGEWLPSPTQKNHPLPLPVDEALYATWEGVIGDLRRLIRSQEGLSVAELAQLGDHKWAHPPGGFIDLGKMLTKPKDIALAMQAIEDLERTGREERTAAQIEALLRNILGEYYVPQMKPSPLIGRLTRMKGEMERGEESFERKLRYLLWVN